MKSEAIPTVQPICDALQQMINTLVRRESITQHPIDQEQSYLADIRAERGYYQQLLASMQSASRPRPVVLRKPGQSSQSLHKSRSGRSVKDRRASALAVTQAQT